MAIICALALLQGGFYALSTCAVALAGATAFVVLALFVKRQRAHADATTVLLLVVALSFLASGLAHGLTATMLQETASWFAIAGLSLWCAQDTQRDKQIALGWLAMAGSALGGIALLVFAGTVLSGNMAGSGRLTFPFEYANTAGLFFAVCAVLGIAWLPPQRRVVSIVPIVALFLTQSVGALAVFAVAVAILLGFQVHRQKARRKEAAVIVVGVVVALAALFVLAPGRVLQSAQTFTERVIQIIDASSLFFANPLFGIGPDQWQIVYPTVQSAQYQALVVHCSYAQIALDGGILAFLAVLALVFGSIVRLARQGDLVSLVCAGMIATHALFDFDLQFSAIVTLLAFLCARPIEVAEARASRRTGFRGSSSRLSEPLCWGVLVLSVVFSCVGIALDVQMGYVQGSSEDESAAQAADVLSSAPWLESDPLLREYAVGALYAAGDYDAVLEMTSDGGDATDRLGLYQALALRAAGQDSAAQASFAHVLHAHPYSVELFEAVRGYIVGEGLLQDGYVTIFNEEARRSNELAASGRASWLSNQETVELIEE